MQWVDVQQDSSAVRFQAKGPRLGGGVCHGGAVGLSMVLTVWSSDDVK